MNFSVSLFANKLKELFLDSRLFPYYDIENESKQSASSKHPNRHPVHLKEIARQCLETSTITTEDSVTFDYGNNVMETNYPHYHILENSQVIHIKGQGTKKSKGSQDKEPILANRDYERVTWNGKTFTKEYSKNVRGSRSKVDKARDKRYMGTFYKDGKLYKTVKNGESPYYFNTHYKYIENILDQDVVLQLEQYFGLKKARKQDTGLSEEYSLQEESGYTTNIFDILNTHDIGE